MANAGTLLTTKLYAPPRRANRVARTRLLERMTNARAAGQKILLVSAPAGFGKTTLVSEWSHSQNRAVAWVALDAADNDPMRFFAYLIAALNPLAPEIFSQLASVNAGAQPPPPETLTAQLLNALSASAPPVTIVLDDYHLVENAALHHAIELLAAQALPHVTLVLTTRSDPPLPLARWRARGLLAETRADDLRFTPDEAAEFLNRAANLDLTAPDIAALEERTEGWIAGLQLAALALEHTKDPHAFIAAFTGNHRFVLDYLMEEVLQQQSETVQRFLLQTSVLERFNAALCDTVMETKAGASQQILAWLERTNLFLIPLDETREWYRYHHLFGDVLQNRLRQTDSSRALTLHTRASEWFEQAGYLHEAISHALSARDYQRAAHWIEKHIDAFDARGESATVLAWLAQIPPVFFLASPQLALARAHVLFSANKLDAAAQDLDTVESTLATQAFDDATRQLMRGRILALRTHITLYRGFAEEALALAEQALAELPPEQARLSSQVYQAMGNANIWTEQLDRADEAFARAVEISTAAQQFPTVVFTLCNRGDVCFHQGKLRAAHRIYLAALELATAQHLTHIPATALAHLDIAHVEYEWNDLTSAFAHAETAISRSRFGGLSRAEMFSRIIMARVCFAQGSRADAFLQLELADGLVHDYKMARRHQAMVDAARFQLWTLSGDLARARAWVEAQQIDAHAPPTYLNEGDLLNLAQLYILEHAYHEAQPLLERLVTAGLAKGRMWTVIRAHASLALVWQGIGEMEHALEHLTHALGIAEPEGYIRTFVAKGSMLVPLLQQFAAHAARAGDANTQRLGAYAAQLISLLPEPPDRAAKTPFARPLQFRNPALIEPLTAREMQMLELVAQGYSDREISVQLHISSATVKKHLANLFGKLDVHSRTQALARAREIGLL